MKIGEYRSILGRLPIKSPSPEDMAMLCPHLTPKEAVKAFTTGSGYVALPPLKVRNGFQIANYRRELLIEGQYTESGKDENRPAMLEYAYAGRTPRSYADGKKHGDVFTRYKHMQQAIKFAENNWGEKLVIDDWEGVIEIYVQDPTDLVNDRYHTDYPRTKAVLAIALKRDLNEIINDHSKPESQLFDEAIAQITIDHKVWCELKGGRGGFTEFNCAHCGAGLGLSGCGGCSHRFHDDQFRCGWNTPLSPKMVSCLHEHGHQFAIDPSIAQEKEKNRWEEIHKHRHQ